MSEGRWRVESASAVLETRFFRVVRSAVRRPLVKTSVERPALTVS